MHHHVPRSMSHSARLGACGARLPPGNLGVIAAERLLGSAETWADWLALGGQGPAVKPVAEFNDAGLMLQAVEQDIGIALARGLLAALQRP